MMPRYEQMSYEEAAQLYECDFETGRITYRSDGSPAFTRVEVKSGIKYYSGQVKGRACGAHRIVWLLAHTEWPKGEVDHIDGNGQNNALSNLRVVSTSENQRNAKLRRDNKSGTAGVFWKNKSNRWIANIRNGKKQIYLGSFKNLDDAVSARIEANRTYGYHPNHGRA